LALEEVYIQLCKRGVKIGFDNLALSLISKEGDVLEVFNQIPLKAQKS